MSQINSIIEGLQIFAGKGETTVEAGHDIIYGSGADLELTIEEIERLEELGWYDNGEFDCWTFSV